MEKNEGARVARNRHTRCGRLTIQFEDRNEVVKRLDENFDERKKNATSLATMWRGATLFLSTGGRRLVVPGQQGWCECWAAQAENTVCRDFMRYGLGMCRYSPSLFPQTAFLCSKPTSKELNDKKCSWKATQLERER